MRARYGIRLTVCRSGSRSSASGSRRSRRLRRWSLSPRLRPPPPRARHVRQSPASRSLLAKRPLPENERKPPSSGALVYRGPRSHVTSRCPSKTPRLKQVLLHREPCRGAPRFDAQLGIDGSKVGVDGPGADSQLLGQLPVSQPVCDEPKDLDLAGGEAVGSGAPRHGNGCFGRLGRTDFSMGNVAIA